MRRAVEGPPPPRPLRIVGWREWVALESFGIPRVKAKVDTGALTSALHAFDVEELGQRDGQPWVRFQVHPVQRRVEPTLTVECPLLGRRRVRSSDGKQTLRPVVRCRLRLGSISWSTDVTLVRRDLMGFRMLLGRRALRRRFVVDCGRSYLEGATLLAHARTLELVPR